MLYRVLTKNSTLFWTKLSGIFIVIYALFLSIATIVSLMNEFG